MDTWEQALVIFGSSVFSWAIIEGIKILAGARKSGLTEAESEYLKDLYDSHNVKDDDGKPIWYISHRITEDQAKIIDNQFNTILNLHRITSNQSDQSKILEKILDKIR